MPAASKSAITSTAKAVRVADKTKTLRKAAAAKPAKAVAPPPAQRGARRRNNASAVTADERQRYIEVAAYYIAERNAFSGNPLEHWVSAEQEVDRLLRDTAFSA